MDHSFIIALAMTVLAGLSTGLGGLLVLWRRPTAQGVGFSLGFAGGVMLCVSLVSILPEGLTYYQNAFSSRFVAGCAAASLLLLGMAIAGLVGGLLPEESDLFLRTCTGGAQDTSKSEGTQGELITRMQALHCGAAVALALMLHNLPEGVLTLFAGVSDFRLGVQLSVAVALHNIPEGISVAAPLWYATHSRFKSAGAAFLSGLAEPVGALLAYFCLRNVLSQGLLHGVSLLVAGAMCWVSGSELLFGGFAMAQKKSTCIGFSVGVAAMILGITALS